MKKKKLIDSFDLLDEKYVEEAAGFSAAGSRYRKKRFRAVIIAATFCLLFATLCMWLFIPYKVETNRPVTLDFDANASQREYREVVEKLYNYYYGKDKDVYTTNFKRILNNFVIRKDDSNAGMDFTGNATTGDSLNGSSAESALKENQSYHETTDNQVAGVIEADLIKRSDKYIYYINDADNELLVYSIEGEDSRLVGSYKLSLSAKVSESSYANVDLGNYEGYLSQDCKTFTVIASFYAYDYGCTRGNQAIISLDVSDPENITEKNRVSVTGDYVTSRLVGDKLLLLNRFDVEYKTDFSTPQKYIPQIDSGNGFECIPATDIHCANNLNSPSYSVLCMMDAESLEIKNCAAFLSYVNTTYVSLNSVYLTNTQYISSQLDDITESKSVSEIRRVDYSGDSFADRGAVTVNGYFKDQYSLDEYNGVLRAVTTTNLSKSKQSSNRNTASSSILESGTSADLYCIDINTMTVISSVESFAPKGETVRSVRFDGNSAYVCTAVQITDPVFFFDLSDLNDIKVKDTGTIDGFSVSLINMGNGYLLGIGTGNGWGTVKIEVYKESENGVVSVCSYNVPNAYYSENYKSYFIDRENGLIGLGISTPYNSSVTVRYLLVRFDSATETLTELIYTPMEGSPENFRAAYIDGFFYIFSDNSFKVIKPELN